MSVLLLAGALAAPSARAQIGQQPLLVTVGSDAACDQSTLADALIDTANNAGPDLIRIARNHTDTAIAVRITDQQVTIEGGFDDCGDTTASGQTTLDGSGGSAASVIEIARKPAGASGADVLLRNLLIRGGEDDAGVGDRGGGGLDISGEMDVRLEGVTVRDNDSLRGGGILVAGSGTSVVVAEGSVVGGGNTALEGGGIFCRQGALAAVVDSRVAGNSAELGGGAVATRGGLLVVGPSGPGNGVISNDAERGGGIYANLASRVELLGDETNPARVASNRALLGTVQRGGGIYATDVGTEVIARNAHILSNTAGDNFPSGGGVHVVSGAFFRMERTFGADCHTLDRCSSLSGNVSGSFAGALAAVSGATAEIHGTYIEDNGPGTILVGDRFISQGATLRAEGVVIANNGPATVVGVRPGSDVRLAFATFADNTLDVGVPEIVVLQSGNLSLHSSLLAEQNPELMALNDGFLGDGFPSLTTDLDCLIVNDDSTLPPGTRIVELAFTFFTDAAGGDYHLLATPLNLAIDFCDDAVAAPASDDIDLEPRGVDVASIPDGVPGGFFDLGADEVQVVPEPGALALGLAATTALAALRRRSRRRGTTQNDHLRALPSRGRLPRRPSEARRTPSG